MDGLTISKILRFQECKDKHNLEEVLINDTNRKKKVMKHDGVGTQSSKGKNEYFVIKMCSEGSLRDARQVVMMGNYEHIYVS